MKFCKDCKHIRMFWLWRLFGRYEFAQCAAVLRVGTENVILVSGGPNPELSFCENQRGNVNTACGPDGKLWEPRA